MFISQTTDFHFANYRFSFRKLQISISQTTDFHFANYRFSFPFRFVPFRFANYSKPNKSWKYVVIMTKYSHVTFLNLGYPINLINSVFNKVLRNIDNIDAAKNTRDDSSTITVQLPFNDQKSANSVRSKCKFWAPTLVSKLNPFFTFRPWRMAKFSLLGANVPKNRPLTIIVKSEKWKRRPIQSSRTVEMERNKIRAMRDTWTFLRHLRFGRCYMTKSLWSFLKSWIYATENFSVQFRWK